MKWMIIILPAMLMWGCTPDQMKAKSHSVASAYSLSDGVGQGNGLTLPYFLKTDKVGFKYLSGLNLHEDQDGSVVINDRPLMSVGGSPSELSLSSVAKLDQGSADELRAIGDKLYPDDTLDEVKVGNFQGLQITKGDSTHYTKEVIFIGPDLHVIQAKADIYPASGGEEHILPILDTLTPDITPPQVLDSKVEIIGEQLVVKLKILDDVSGVRGYRQDLFEVQTRLNLDHGPTLIKKSVFQTVRTFEMLDDDWYSFKIDINKYAPTGEYKPFSMIGIVDWSGNYNWFTLPEQSFSFTNTLGVDLLPPVVEAIVSDGPCWAGEHCTIKAKISDDLSGIDLEKSSFGLILGDNTNPSASIYRNYKVTHLTDDWFSIDFEISAWTTPGSYHATAYSFIIFDYSRNYSQQVPEDFSLLIINNCPLDHKSPEILDSKFPQTMERGKNYKILLKLKDDLSGINLDSLSSNYAYFTHEELGLKAGSLEISPGKLVAVGDDWYETTFYVNPYLVPGIYVGRNNINVSDNAGNGTQESIFENFREVTVK